MHLISCRAAVSKPLWCVLSSQDAHLSGVSNKHESCSHGKVGLTKRADVRPQPELTIHALKPRQQEWQLVTYGNEGFVLIRV